MDRMNGTAGKMQFYEEAGMKDLEDTVWIYLLCVPLPRDSGLASSFSLCISLIL